MKQTKPRRLIVNICSLAIVFVIMSVAAYFHTGKILGNNGSDVSDISGISDSIQTVQSGPRSITTEKIGRDIVGYAGNVPVKINIGEDGRILSVEALDNVETPAFFNRVVESGILERWNGLTPEEALKVDVDAVSGATFSSTALIKNVRAGLVALNQSAGNQKVSAISEKQPVDVKYWLALVVLIAAAVLPLFIQNKVFRIVQQIVNVGVLGFWTGTFLDYTNMLSVLSSGLTTTMASISMVVLLTVGFIYPLFGRKGYYCANVCPLGSMQELAARCNPRHHIPVSPKVLKLLKIIRTAIWLVLMLLLLTGAWASWIDYELFTAFMVESAATGVIIATVVVVLISIWIPRPYCRFVCPTGTLLRFAQDILKN